MVKEGYRWDVGEHMKYRVLTAQRAVVKLWVFNCACTETSQGVPRVLLHSFVSAVTSHSELLSGRGEPPRILSQKICPSYRQTNSIALQGHSLN